MSSLVVILVVFDLPQFVAQEVSKSTDLVVRNLDGSKLPKSLRHSFLTPTDVIVSTPGPVLNCLRQSTLQRSLSHSELFEL